MLSVKGIYDGIKIYPTEPLKEDRKYKVIITFLEEIKDEEEKDLRSFGSSANAALDFWSNPGEDVYQDYLPSK
jgi:hypothetical protein